MALKCWDRIWPVPFHADFPSATPGRAIGLLALALASCATCNAAAKDSIEPRITSISPCIGTAASSVTVRIRGTKLENALAIWSPLAGLSVTAVRYVPSVSTESGEGWVEADLIIPGNIPDGTHPLRVVTAAGLTNSLPFEVTRSRVQDERVGGELTGPAVITGTLTKPGEVDTYWFRVSAGETWTFEGKGGGSTNDLALALYEPSGSWFDSRRLNRVASNDEPLHFPGLSSSPRLVHRFRTAGRYGLSVSAFGGQGGPDAVYVLKATLGVTAEPSLHPESDHVWEERQFTRVLTPDWLQRVAARGNAGPALRSSIETWAAVDAAAPALPIMSIPGTAQGVISSPAATQAIQVRVDQPQELVLEIETPKATMPRFNPVIRLLDSLGNELVTNVHTKRNNNGLYMMKMIHPKATVTLRSAGVYRLEIRDITTDCSGEDFAYRVLVRPNLPHLGKVILSEAQVNLRLGSASELHLTTEREEGFAGTVAFELEGLPVGVSVGPGVANPVERPPLPNAGKIERYTPRSQASVLLVVAAPDAAPTGRPVLVRLYARPIVDKKLGDRILVREFPLFLAAGGS